MFTTFKEVLAEELKANGYRNVSVPIPNVLLNKMYLVYDNHNIKNSDFMRYIIYLGLSEFTRKYSQGTLGAFDAVFNMLQYATPRKATDKNINEIISLKLEEGLYEFNAQYPEEVKKHKEFLKMRELKIKELDSRVVYRALIKDLLK